MSWKQSVEETLTLRKHVVESQRRTQHQRIVDRSHKLNAAQTEIDHATRIIAELDEELAELNEMLAIYETQRSLKNGLAEG